MKTAVELLNHDKARLDNRLRNGFGLQELETAVHRARQEVRVRLESAMKETWTSGEVVTALKTIISELP